MAEISKDNVHYMTYRGNMSDRAQAVIWNLAEDHRKTWRDKSKWYWYFGLLEEVLELGLALAGWHKNKHRPTKDDDVGWELRQIGSIALNWIRFRDDQKRAE